jgi:hypothetical protein
MISIIIIFDIDISNNMHENMEAFKKLQVKHIQYKQDCYLGKGVSMLNSVAQITL